MNSNKALSPELQVWNQSFVCATEPRLFSTPASHGCSAASLSALRPQAGLPFRHKAHHQKDQF